MKSLFFYRSYKSYVQDRIRSMPKRGREELQRLAQELRMHPTRVSHVFNGELQLTLEQASGLCRYWALTQLESEYFVTLVQIARAGTKPLLQILETQAEGIRSRATLLVNRLPRDKILSESDKAVFYSSWIYSGIRLLTSVESYQTLDSISAHFHLPRDRVREVLDFLVSAGLCTEEAGRYRMGEKRTHLEASSPMVKRHHANRRLKALSRHEHLTDHELAYTAPVSLTREDQKRLRELLVQTIDKFVKTAAASEPPELVACLNVDWIEVS